MVSRESVGMLIIAPLILLIVALPTQWILSTYYPSIYGVIGEDYFIIIGVLLILTEVYVALAEFG